MKNRKEFDAMVLRQLQQENSKNERPDASELSFAMVAETGAVFGLAISHESIRAVRNSLYRLQETGLVVFDGRGWASVEANVTLWSDPRGAVIPAVN